MLLVATRSTRASIAASLMFRLAPSDAKETDSSSGRSSGSGASARAAISARRADSNGTWRWL